MAKRVNSPTLRDILALLDLRTNQTKNFKNSR